MLHDVEDGVWGYRRAFRWESAVVCSSNNKGPPMARLTKTDAARHLGIARSTLYKLIDQGALSPTADGLIDSTELVRAAPLVDRLKHRSQAPANTRQTSANSREMDTQRQDERHHGHV